MTVTIEKKKQFIRFDPRTKIILLVLSMIVATTTPSLLYECVLILLIAGFGSVCGKVRYSLIGSAVFMALYLSTVFYLENSTGTMHTMFTAWLSLVFKVYPGGMLAGIAVSTTRVNEFLSAMNKAHISRKIIIPLAVMLRYIPTIREDWRYIKDAMRLRDVSPSIIGLFTHPGMTVECLYSPLLMAASKAADELAIASVTRGIENPKPRTCLIQIRFRIQDVLIILCFLAVPVASLCC
ncbi:energy-coupling factor transport system permease protein [Sporobacter termitidis DSM 10068]|uniref:Energy-coupling factor transport system permease protein n=1 Tax=Sporobacter termitidis DSM 10068 TaxID=1123282 RepID=A0A1M5W5A7_9FIRM|nr:energy-coupling factor transporter transmembrane component T [Sporobacter termitidis]SHH82657.1 energy-coupling factor transport system permease protein [Sporobacter termitidis DSM 10068]